MGFDTIRINLVFFSFLTLYLIPHTSIALGISERDQCELPVIQWNISEWMIIDCLGFLTQLNTIGMHERSAFQPVAVQAVDWHVNSGSKECSDQKTYLAKVDGSSQKHRDTPSSRPCRPFWGPLTAILDFWGSHRRNGRIKKLI